MSGQEGEWAPIPVQSGVGKCNVGLLKQISEAEDQHLMGNPERPVAVHVLA